jgi:hypothetical protein
LSYTLRPALGSEYPRVCGWLRLTKGSWSHARLCCPEGCGCRYGGATVRDALAYMAAQGLAVGLLYGHPEYYPRLGFAPVLPAQLTTLAVGAIPRGERVEQAALACGAEQAYRPAGPGMAADACSLEGGDVAHAREEAGTVPASSPHSSGSRRNRSRS